MGSTALPARPQPVRLPKRYARHTNHFVAFSPKANCDLEFFGEPEFDFWALQETDPDVVSLCSQPGPIIEGTVNGKKTQYVFDLWALRNNGREVYTEVKPAAHLVEGPDGRRVPRKWGIGSAWCHKFGKDCSFVTDEEIYADMPRVQNAHRIASWAAFGHRYSDQENQAKVLGVLQLHGPLAMAQLIELLPALDTSVIIASAAMLTCYGKATIKMDGQPFGRQSGVETRRG